MTTEQQLSPRERAVIAKYLIEARGKEQQLETALQAQIALAKSPLFQHALTDHLKVTRRQISAITQRLQALGEADHGSTSFVQQPVDAVAGLATAVVNKGMALAKGPLQMFRGTSPGDNDLRNIRDCFWNEAEEIAHYKVIETVAQQLGDTKTLELAQRHRKEEEEMQHTLEGLFPGVVRSVVEQEIPPAAKRPGPVPTKAAAARKPAAKKTPAKRTPAAKSPPIKSSSAKRASSTKRASTTAKAGASS